VQYEQGVHIKSHSYAKVLEHLHLVLRIQRYASNYPTLGPCGCGKGSLAERLIANYHLHHLSTGHWLREQGKAPIADVSDRINDYVSQGLQIPLSSLIDACGEEWTEQTPPPLLLCVCSKANASTPASMWIRALPALKHECEEISKAQGKHAKKAILLDNFPKTLAQAGALELHLGTKNLVLAFSLTHPVDVNLARFLSRGRGKDDARTFGRRLRRFAKESPAVIDMYSEAGKLVEVDASNTPEEVYEEAVGGLVQHKAWTRMFAEKEQKLLRMKTLNRQQKFQ
jgi:adenylate kinase family enzyme